MRSKKICNCELHAPLPMCYLGPSWYNIDYIYPSDLNFGLTFERLILLILNVAIIQQQIRARVSFTIELIEYKNIGKKTCVKILYIAVHFIFSCKSKNLTTNESNGLSTLLQWKWDLNQCTCIKRFDVRDVFFLGMEWTK